MWRCTADQIKQQQRAMEHGANHLNPKNDRDKLLPSIQLKEIFDSF